MSETRRLRVATYRLQLTPDAGFDRAATLVEPLRRLGVSHLYLSPLAQSVPTSTHGYDVVDHRIVRAEFGGRAALWELLDHAADRGLGVIVDHVPNHVSVEHPHLNPHWWALLRDGPGSPEADWFDIDWDAADGTVIVPRLGDPVAQVLENGQLTVHTGDGEPELRYGPLRFPVRPGTEDLDLPELVEAQHYRLTWWRAPERNARRFFTIDDLVAVCVEHDRVRDVVDSLPRELCAHPAFDGVRIDHVDGLAEPGAYLAQLRDLLGDRWILVEKILGPGEALPAGWPVDGTTGYEFVVAAEHALVDPTGRTVFDDLAGTATGSDLVDDSDDSGYHDVEDVARREVLEDGLRPDLDRLMRELDAAVRDTACDEPPVDTDVLRAAIVALTVGLDRYRTYLPDDTASHEVLAEVAARTTREQPDLGAAVSWFVDRLTDTAAVRRRWQQLTGPAMAKGAEDRAFFRHIGLAGFNEVGGRPDRWSIDIDEFHDDQRRRAASAPFNLLASTTHDTKRSSGVRARSLALSAFAQRFADVARAWSHDHADVVDELGHTDVSHALQTAVTAWPIDAERLGRFLVKSAREADLQTSWIEPDDRYEAALARLAERIRTSVSAPDDALGQLANDVADLGGEVGHAVEVLHLTCAGVPDLYQGMPGELLTLVDPDNRGEPDWTDWRRRIERVGGRRAPAPAPTRDADLATLTMRLLDLRRRRPDAFGVAGTHVPLQVTGPAADRLLGFGRGVADRIDVVVVVVPLGLDVADVAASGVTIPTGRWRPVTASTTGRVHGGVVPVPAIVGARRAGVLERDD